MGTLAELVNTDDPAIAKLREWMQNAVNPCELLPPSEQREEVLLQTQVTTRSTMGAIAFETGGILIDGGWLRFLGSGHPKLPRTSPRWNQGRSSGFYLVADDAIGGFFAINGGAFGDDLNNMYYWPPDSLDWEPMRIGFTDFLRTYSRSSALSSKISILISICPADGAEGHSFWVLRKLSEICRDLSNGC